MGRYPASQPSLRSSLAYIPVYAAKLQKVIAIWRTLRSLPRDCVYIETNHMFIISFYDVIMRHFRDVTVIHLRRYLPKVLKSFLELDSFGKSPHTPFWTTPPDSPSAAIAPPMPIDQMDQCDRCIAYLIDIEARAERFRRRFPHTPVLEVRLEELNDWHHVERLFRDLGLTPTEATRQRTGAVMNARRQRKDAVRQSASSAQLEADEDYCLDRINRYVTLCASAGIELPTLPQLVKI